MKGVHEMKDTVQNKSKGSMIAGFLSIVCAVASLAASADIVGWYHFDEAPTGTTATAETVLVNSIDPTKGAGYCRVFKYNRSVYYNQPTIDTAPAELMPAYADGVPENIAFLDPLTGTTLFNRRALQCTSTNPAGLTSQDGSIVYLADTELNLAQAFTVEFFIKVSSQTADWTSLIKKYAGGFSASRRIFSIELQSKKPVLALTTTTGAYSASANTAICDDKWHHIAIVVDTAAKMARFHLDSWAKSLEIDGEIDYTDANPLTFASSPNSYIAPATCMIDEVRIADTALEASQLLSAKVRAPVSPLTDSRTLVYVDFSGSLDEVKAQNSVAGTASYVPALLNRAPYNAAYDKTQMQFYWAQSSTPDPANRKLINDVPKAQLRIGTSVQSVTNESAYWSGVSDATVEKPAVPMLGIAGTERYIYEDSFTMEFFLNCGTAAQFDIGKHNYSYIAGQAGESGMMWDLFSPKESRLQLSVGGKYMTWDEASDATGEVTKKKFNDGKWHHFAIVYDKSSDRVDVYVDYRHFGGASGGISFGTPRGSFGQMSFLAYYYMNSSWGDYSGYAMSNAKFDELRITRGVLTTEEFLRDPKKGLAILLR